jgi:hypothetical protein
MKVLCKDDLSGKVGALETLAKPCTADHRKSTSSRSEGTAITADGPIRSALALLEEEIARLQIP